MRISNPIVLSFALGLASAQTIAPLSTKAGTIQGIQCNSTTAVSYLSIPYAQPPVGDLRFAAPQAYNSAYTGTFQATKSAPACLQFGDEFIEESTQSEDCLYLDIWVPQGVTNTSGLPVKVWIYGGSQTAGGISDPLYNGCNLASNGDSIVVSINYRLGPLGWLTLDSAGITGNFGTQDILLALEWIQLNIVSFGGNPAKVLLFGQSAGAANTFIISSLPQAPSLINAAIMESGGGRSYPGSAAANAFGAKYASLINCSTTDIACFRSASIKALNTSVPSNTPVLTVIRAVSYTDWNPHVDGKIIPVDPASVGVQVPAIFGSNAMEGSLFAIEYYGRSFFNLTAANYTQFLQYNFGSAASLIQQHYPLAAFNHSPFPAFSAIVEIYTQVSYKCPAYRGLMQAAAKNISTWTYFSSHVPTCPWYALIPDDADALAVLGAAHTSEIPLVFSNTQNLPLPNGNCTLDSDEQNISAQLVAAWTNMAAYANPDSGLLKWPKWDPSGSTGINIVNSTVPGAVDYSACQIWDVISSTVLNDSSPAGAATQANATSSSGSNGSSSGTGTSSTGTPKASVTTTNGAAVLSVQLVISASFVISSFFVLL